jgi:UDP-N-acetylmuramoyl-tripeptide--D-alanyl-D-alanine ligase
MEKQAMKTGKKIRLADFINWSGSVPCGSGTSSGSIPERVFIGAISTDSRTLEEGDFFIPVSGPNFNGHDFLYEALKKKACGFVFEANFTEKINFVLNEFGSGFKDRLIILKSDDNMKFLLDLASNYLKQFRVKKIGITGSYGKTTAKDFVTSIMQRQFKIRYTPENFNTEIGISKSMLQTDDGTEYFISELGMRGMGQIGILAGALNLDIAAITAVGPVHLEFFSDIGQIARAKAEIAAPIQENGGVLFLNSDDRWTGFIQDLVSPSVPAAQTCSASPGARIIKFGRNNNLEYNFIEKGSDDFGRFSADFFMKGKKIADVKLPVSGIHNIYNACCAAAICSFAGVKPGFIKEGIENAAISGNRMNAFAKGENIIISDCYNANPDSVKCAIDTLKLISAKKNMRSVAILADMYELGHDTGKLHFETGKYLKNSGIDVLVAVGKHSGRIVDGFGQKPGKVPGKSGDLKSRQVSYFFKDAVSLIPELGSIIKKNDVLLIKGSRANKLECLIDLI